MKRGFMTKQQDTWALDTITIHGGASLEDPAGALVPPLYQTSTFVFPSTQVGGARFAAEETGYIYTRLGNPTVHQLETKMALLEGMEAAAGAATGMGAVSAATLAFLKAGDHVISSDSIYGCSFALFTELFTRFGIEVTFVDMSEPENILKAIQTNTKLLFLETPANPQLKVYSLQEIGKICATHQLKFVVDNTFMTPLLQRPGEYGAHIVVHSATKYLNGHGDVVAGIITGSEEDIQLIKGTTLKDMGATLSPHDAWLISRGLKTLAIRMQRHCENAQKVAEYLKAHSAIEQVYFPGLPNDPGYALVGENQQMKSGGAVIAFDMKGGYQAAENLLNKLKLIRLAVSLGDAESLIQHPASMTHSPLTEEARAKAGIGEGLVRMSVGLENVQDILSDLTQALP